MYPSVSHDYSRYVNDRGLGDNVHLMSLFNTTPNAKRAYTLQKQKRTTPYYESF